MRILLACAAVLALGMVWLWREVATGGPTAPATAASAPTAVVRAPSAGRRAPLPLAATAAAAPSPPGGVRAWSPSAAPTDGPDPFAAVPQVRTADDTRAGLTE